MYTILTLFTSLLAASSALAHLQLSWPYPLHSSLNPDTPESIKDYSMTSPLITDGTYPCKGFINDPESGMSPTASWDAGATINYTVVGTATHGGGSCQVSMSYDNGTTWNVILSQIGGCPIDTMTTELTIPTDAPSGYALFAWGWFNLEGNREMYHNCAPVTISNGGSGFNDDDYPTPFVANADVNDCVTIENVAVVFPYPGKNVVYGGDYADSQPTEAAGYTGTNCVGDNSTTSSSTSSSSSSAGAESSSTYAVEATSTSVEASATSADSAISVSASISISAGVTIGSSAETSSTAAEAVATTSSSSASTSGKTCNRKRSKEPKKFKRSKQHHRRRSTTSPHGHLSLRNSSQDLDARNPDPAPKRVAATKASHKSRSEDKKRDTPKRVAATKASHPGRSETKRGDGTKRWPASKATHVRDVKGGMVGRMFYQSWF